MGRTCGKRVFNVSIDICLEWRRTFVGFAGWIYLIYGLGLGINVLFTAVYADWWVGIHLWCSYSCLSSKSMTYCCLPPLVKRCEAGNELKSVNVTWSWSQRQMRIEINFNSELKSEWHRTAQMNGHWISFEAFEAGSSRMNELVVKSSRLAPI